MKRLTNIIKLIIGYVRITFGLCPQCGSDPKYNAGGTCYVCDRGGIIRFVWWQRFLNKNNIIT